MPDASARGKLDDEENENTISRRGAKLYEEYKRGQVSRDDFLDAIVELVHRPLVSYIFHRSGYQANYEDQEDVFQQVLVRFLEAQPNLTDTLLMPWLFTVARHLLIDRWRQSENRSELAFDDQNDSHGVSLHPAQTREWFIEQALRDAMKALSLECVFVLDMCICEGHSQVEVAEMLQKPRSTIEYYIRSAKQRLRESSQLKELIIGSKSLQKEQR